MRRTLLLTILLGVALAAPAPAERTGPESGTYTVDAPDGFDVGRDEPTTLRLTSPDAPGVAMTVLHAELGRIENPTVEPGLAATRIVREASADTHGEHRRIVSRLPVRPGRGGLDWRGFVTVGAGTGEGPVRALWWVATLGKHVFLVHLRQPGARTIDPALARTMTAIATSLEPSVVVVGGEAVAMGIASVRSRWRIDGLTFAPDGESIVYCRGGRLLRVGARGGPDEVLLGDWGTSDPVWFGR